MVSQAPKWWNTGGTPLLPLQPYPVSVREGKRSGDVGQRNGLTWREVEKDLCCSRSRRNAPRYPQFRYPAVMSDGLLRISEVTELRISDLEENTLRLRFSKTDQEGQGEHLYLCEDTRQIVGQWLKRSGLTEGYLFRRMTPKGDKLYRDKGTGDQVRLRDDGVRRVIKSCAARVGLTEKVAGHSLRIGMTVSLAKSGVFLVDIQVAGRWEPRICLFTMREPNL